MFHHVIVPFDGSLEARAVFAPAADLAWRCGAKVVIVSTSAIDDDAVQYLLKSQAIAKSGADVSFWVDAHAELGDAVLEATRFRSDPIVCMASRYRSTGLVRKKQTASTIPEAVLRHSSVPLLIIGPETDLSRGLALAELIMPIDDTAESVRAARLAADVAASMRLGVRFLFMVPPGGDAVVPDDVRAIVDEIRAQMPAVELELIETDRPGRGAGGHRRRGARRRDPAPAHRRRRARGTGPVPGRGRRHQPPSGGAGPTRLLTVRSPEGGHGNVRPLRPPEPGRPHRVEGLVP